MGTKMNTSFIVKKFRLASLLLLFPALAEAKLSVITTTSDLAAIAAEVGGEDASAESIAKGSQDPHFIEAKPSYMVKVSKADLLLSIGLELEVGWLPPLIRGARNPKVKEGEKGFLEVGHLVEPIEIPDKKLTRADGDVHPDGNPHVTLDPVRAGKIAVLIAERLAELDSGHASGYRARAKALDDRLKQKTAGWKARIDKSGVKSVVSYHKTLSYFFDRFGLKNPAILEPKPGIPPTSAHIIEVIAQMKKDKIPLIMVENYFDAAVTKKIQSELPSIRTEIVAVAVGGDAKTGSIDELFENLVKAVEGK